MTETPLFDLPAPTEQAPRKPIKGRSGAYLTNPMLALPRLRLLRNMTWS